MSQAVGDSRTSNGDSRNQARAQKEAPEKALTRFAMQLALFEKTATGLGALGFIWATVVLLGGFAITLDTTDFWFITVILVIEGARIFSRSHELEWRHQATWSVTGEVLPLSARNDVENPAQPVEECCGNPFVFVTNNLSVVLYWLQLLSATTCIVLSLMKLILHNFGHVEKGDTDKRNREAALFMFYALALAEAALFVMEKVYWEWMSRYVKLLEWVNTEYALGDLGADGMISTKRFFYDAYSKSINGSVFDSMRMDMISFAVELLTSNSPNEQLNGARLLRSLSMNAAFSAVTLRKIGVDLSVVERLVEMLNWRNPNESEIRESAAVILREVASQMQNSLRIAEIPGAVESVASLLHTEKRTYTGTGDEICRRDIFTSELETRLVQNFNFLGLQILNELSRDHDNCGKIGNTRGLLVKIIDFTYTTEDMFRTDDTFKNGKAPSHIRTAELSLNLVKMLVSTTGITGWNLRKEISEIVFTVGNVRNILKYAKSFPSMQLLGIQVLSYLGLEDDATEKIGGTGGVLKELLEIFFKIPANDEDKNLINAAGDALEMLTLESKKNCHQVLKLEAMDKLVKALGDEALCINTARILMNLCIYTEDPRLRATLLGVKATAPIVLKAIMESSDKRQEVMTGLGLRVFKEMEPDEFGNTLRSQGLSESVVAAALVGILNKTPNPSITVPRIRRFAIALAIWMMRANNENVRAFKTLELESKLMEVIETTTDVENYHFFFGKVGVIRHERSLHSLVEEALSCLSSHPARV